MESIRPSSYLQLIELVHWTPRWTVLRGLATVVIKLFCWSLVFFSGHCTKNKESIFCLAIFASNKKFIQNKLGYRLFGTYLPRLFYSKTISKDQSFKPASHYLTPLPVYRTHFPTFECIEPTFYLPSLSQRPHKFPSSWATAAGATFFQRSYLYRRSRKISNWRFLQTNVSLTHYWSSTVLCDVVYQSLACLYLWQQKFKTAVVHSLCCSSSAIHREHNRSF